MDQLTVYEPNSRKKIGFFKTWSLMFANIASSRELIAQVFVRDFLAAYKKSFIGLGWLVITPIIGILSWTIMNAAGILRPGDVGIPYPAYVLIGSSIWGLFLGFYQSASQTLSAGSSFILQVKYPHEVLLVKQTAQHLADFLVGFAMNLAVLLAFGVVPSWKIVFFPLAVLPLFFFGAAIGLVMSIAKIIAVDIQKASDLVMGLMIYLTPVIYSADVVHPMLAKIVRLNPLSYLICGARDLILYGRIEHFGAYLAYSAMALVAFLSAWRLFFLCEDKVVERIL